MKRAEWQSLFAQFPPGMRLSVIARQIKQSYRLTATWAKRLGYPAASGHKLLWTRQRRREFSRVPWGKVPWRLENVEIAKLYGVSREIVRRRRKQYGNHETVSSQERE